MRNLAGPLRQSISLGSLVELSCSPRIHDIDGSSYHNLGVDVHGTF